MDTKIQSLGTKIKYMAASVTPLGPLGLEMLKHRHRNISAQIVPSAIVQVAMIQTPQPMKRTAMGWTQLVGKGQERRETSAMLTVPIVVYVTIRRVCVIASQDIGESLVIRRVFWRPNLPSPIG
jgi:hypothetical protein